MLLFVLVSTSAYNVEQTVVMTLVTWPNRECLIVGFNLWAKKKKKYADVCRLVMFIVFLMLARTHDTRNEILQ